MAYTSPESYTLPEWTGFLTKDPDIRLKVQDVTITKAHIKNAVPKSKMHCSVANGFAGFTSMDPNMHQISVDAQYIKCVVNGIRYFFIQEVAGAEHIQQLDNLALCEEADVEALNNFEPFKLKIRYHDERPVYERIHKTKSKPQENKEVKTAVEVTKGNGKPTPTLVEPIKEVEKVAPTTAVISPRAPRKDTGETKSRWSRKVA